MDAVTAGPSWRAMTDEPFWTQYDTVIISNAGPRPSYEVFIRGRQVATRDRLDDAKTFVEKEYGPLQWSRKRLDKMEVTHRFFGPTTEFGEAATIHVSDLPRMRGVAVRVPNNSIGYGAGHDNLPEVSDQLPLRTRGSSLPRGVGGHDGPPSADGQPPRRDVVAGRDGLPEHGSLSRTASRLSPSDVSGWASSRPWMATKAEVEMSSVGYLYVLSRAKSSGHMASFDTGSGRIGVTSAYFEVAEDSRRAILYHEAGHALEVAAGMAGIAKAFGVANALDILSLPGADRFGYNASEIAAQAYSVLWTEPQWASFPGGAEILAAGARLARDHGWPIPSGAKTASDYEMDHRPLEDAAPMHDLSATFPDDVYDHPEYYSFGEWTAEAGRVLRQAKGKPDAQVAIYRALPAGETRINTGDWVTTVRSYAALHLQKMERGRQWHIVSATVPARTLRTGGNDIIEWGYWGSPVGARVASLDNPRPVLAGADLSDRAGRDFRPGQPERSYVIDHRANPYWYTDIEGAIDGTIKGKTGAAERSYEEEIEHFLAEAKASGKADFGSTAEAKRFLEPIVGRYGVRIQVSHKNPDGTLGLGAKAWVYKDGGQWVLNLRPEYATKEAALHEAAHIVDVETNGWPEGGVSRMIDMKQSWAHGPRFQEVLQSLQRFGSLRTRGKAVTAAKPDDMTIEVTSKPFHDPFMRVGPEPRLSDDGIIYEAHFVYDDGQSGDGGYMRLRRRLSDDVWEIWRIDVPDVSQRKGIASAMLEQARKDLGRVDHAPDWDRTDDGRAWSFHVGSATGAYYHGTNAALSPGASIQPASLSGSRVFDGSYDHYDPSYVYLTDQEHQAEKYALLAVRKNGGEPHVYRVRPIGTVFRDPEFEATGFGSDQWVATMGEVVEEIPLPGRLHLEGDAIMRGPAKTAVFEGDLSELNSASPEVEKGHTSSKVAGFGDDPETQRRLEELAEILTTPTGRPYDPIGDLPDPHAGYGGYISQDRSGRLTLEGRPITKLYRVVDPGEWGLAQQRGYLQSHNEYTRASAKPDERWRNQGAAGVRGYTLEIDYDPSDDWHASAEGYAATRTRIPLSRVRKIGSRMASTGGPERINARDWNRGDRVVVARYPDEEGTVVKIQGQGIPYSKVFLSISFDSDPDRPAQYDAKECRRIPSKTAVRTRGRATR